MVITVSYLIKFIPFNIFLVVLQQHFEYGALCNDFSSELNEDFSFIYEMNFIRDS